jgi:hypothetical protein
MIYSSYYAEILFSPMGLRLTNMAPCWGVNKPAAPDRMTIDPAIK